MDDSPDNDAVTPEARRPGAPATSEAPDAATPSGSAVPVQRSGAGGGLRASLWQFVRFCVVGGSGVVVNLLVFTFVLLVWLLAAGHIHAAGGLASAAHGLMVKRTPRACRPPPPTWPTQPASSSR